MVVSGVRKNIIVNQGHGQCQGIFSVKNEVGLGVFIRVKSLKTLIVYECQIITGDALTDSFGNMFW